MFTAETGSESGSEQEARHEESTKTKTKVAEQVSGGEHESAGVYMYVCMTLTTNVVRCAMSVMITHNYT